nr:FAD-dependent oxidoreductase [uncultured Pseudomonas sp.]
MHDLERNAPRIAVIGAGPAGLTAADTLRRRGYQHVTVFEKLGRVGGKVHSFRNGANVVELGAVLASSECTQVLRLADRCQVAYAPYPVSLAILDEHGQRQSIESFLRSRYQPDEIQRAIGNYIEVLQRFPELHDNGFSSLSSDLTLPFQQFAAKYDFVAVAELARSLLIGFGYSYYETTPAVYFMKLIGWLLKPGGPNGLQPGDFYMFPGGYQSIWEAVAQDLDVRLDADVTSIRRAASADSPVQVTVNGVSHEFDAVIVSAPLNRVGEFLDLSANEAQLFAQVCSDRYFVNLFNASGLGTGEFLFFHDHAHPAKLNHVNAWANRDPSVPLYISWQLTDRALTLDQVTATLAEDVAAQGGEFQELKLRQEWDYFPRVSSAALQNGFFQQVEALQGIAKVFYVGSSLSFETVEHSARYAEALVTRYFAPLGSDD